MFILSSAKLADVPRIVELHLTAHQNNAFAAAQFPTQQSIEELGHFLRAAYPLQMKTPGFILHTLRELSTGEIVAFANWIIPSKNPVTLEDDHGEPSSFSVPPPYPLVDQPDDMDRFLSQAMEQRNKIMGDKAFYELSALVTDPAHRRRGAASALCKWGMDRADANDLDCYLESSPEAVDMYKKWGWVDVGTFDIGFQTSGGHATYTTTYMVRNPAS